jgi:transposase
LYSTKQRIFIIEDHIRSSENKEKVRRAFQVKFGVKVGPDRYTVSNLVKKCRKTGSVLDDYSQSGRPSTARTETNIKSSRANRLNTS